METLYVTKDAKLEREDSTLIIKVPDLPKRRIPIEMLRHVVLAGDCGLTTPILSLMGRNDLRVTVLDWYGNVTGTFEPLGKPSAAVVRLAQARHASDPTLRMTLAKQIVTGTMTNLIANLRYRAYRGQQKLDGVIEAISRLRDSTDNASAIDQLMGYEGNARAWYFAAWKDIDAQLDFGPRRRQPPNNPINCLISWFNGLAYSLTRNEIAKTYLDDCISFLHAPREARHSLALDLSEPFKPVIVDTIIFETVKRGPLPEEWFHQEDGVCRLSDVGRRKTLDLWVAKIETHKEGGESMRENILKEALAVERHVLGISEYKAYRRRV